MTSQTSGPTASAARRRAGPSLKTMPGWSSMRRPSSISRSAVLRARGLLRLQPLAPLVVGATGPDALAAHDPHALRLRGVPGPAGAAAGGASVLLGNMSVALGHARSLGGKD